MNIEIGQLKMVLSWYAWELQQIVGRPVSKNKIDGVNQKRKISFILSSQYLHTFNVIKFTMNPYIQQVKLHF